ncbi:malate dehydrogenase (quinone) [Ralstonia solanacearum]|uniref:Probable malate:quinone oxidoreductase n=1 Tax=Ralstonia solanacearum (strain Po82) TaxID=1031711 RepID=F6GAH8_RALS8|nr:malate dehydrogenase (quinone) [Ralstonia solanacearum]AEG71766.1 malate:quinone oxidoreductase (malatedehydrogenase [acceptor]) (mqo) protein [Ralstonia solanacearum Po82]AMP71655.1 malate:quinone oxidoreductase [Ralstonia solanacearum]AMP76418.1 malate:quinone oxidoreductase [Ralstonia solanacearum]AYB63068.1 malate dehydrogenase (quinone) [Ralstonia solanacearum]MBB6588769.1 malate dehydrogenase (quinone) [Ralstonia solanacearum]
MIKAIRVVLSGVVVSLAAFSAQAADTKKVDVLLVGGGIMSSTLGVWLHELEPDWSMMMVERLDGVAQESSNGWNNAGTGHSALAELNYTPEKSNGKIDISKAVEINEGFQVSRQFWTYQVKNGVLKNPHSFINSTPHMSFVWGDENVRYLKKRYEALQASPLFRGMQFSDDYDQISKWVPLMMEGRDRSQKVAATWMPVGTDVNFGEITRQFVAYLQSQPQFTLSLSSEVREIKRNDDGTWRVSYVNLKSGDRQDVDAKFLFIGAGGGALRLLQASGIPEARDFAAFPVGGSFLVTENPDIVNRHLAKAYGKASVGSPPMSVPHLDTRVIDGKRIILFGPFATFSTKFLKNGSYMDLFGSTTSHNVMPMLHVGVDEFPLVQYLAGQLMLSDEDRFNALKEYFPLAKKEDWRLWQAGQRVQIIQRDEAKGGILKLGTQIVKSKDNTIAGLLGASPGASTAAPIMLGVLETVFKDKLATPAWQQKVHQMIPTYGTKLNDNPAKVYEEWVATSEVLQLAAPPKIDLTPTASAAKPVAGAAQPAKAAKAGKPAKATADIAL